MNDEIKLSIKASFSRRLVIELAFTVFDGIEAFVEMVINLIYHDEVVIAVEVWKDFEVLIIALITHLTHALLPLLVICRTPLPYMLFQACK